MASIDTTIWPPSRRVLLIGGGVLALGVTGYLTYRHFTSHVECVGALERAENKKKHGIEAYRSKNYDEALRLFDESIMLSYEKPDESDKAKREELLASCENNIAACYDALGDTVRCLDHCNAAIAIKSDYAKALARRAKCYCKLEQKEKALHDFLELINLENIDQQQMHFYQTELDRIAESIIDPELKDIIQRRSSVPLKISQQTVSAFLHATVVNDPILARMEKLNVATDTFKGVDEALVALKRGRYDEISGLISPIISDDSFDSLERAYAVLLAARFIYYEGSKDKAKETAQQFGRFWETLDDAQKLNHKDLYVAYISLQLTLTLNELGEDESNIGNGVTISEVIKRSCYQLVDDGLRINPKNVDPLITFAVRLMEAEQHEEAIKLLQRARKLDQKHPYVRFYEIYSHFMIGLRQESLSIVHKQIVLMQQSLVEADKPPVFALIMLSKLAMMLQNNQLAIESIKKALAQMPNCSYAIYLCGLMDQEPEPPNNREKIITSMHRIERVMRKSIEVDPNYWEPYRILGKIYIEEKQDFETADQFYVQALELARSRFELTVLLKERLMLRMLAERKKKRQSTSERH